MAPREHNDDETYRDWPHNLKALQEIGLDLLEEWKEEKPHTTRDYPTTRWLTNNGYSHLRWILSQKHDMRIDEFFILLTSAGGSDGYDYHIDDVATINLTEKYLEDRVECRDWAASTMRTYRARINEFYRRIDKEFETTNILLIFDDPEDSTDVYEKIKKIVLDLREELVSLQSVHQYLRAIHRFTEWLDRSNRISKDPIEGIEEDFTWSWDNESEALTGDQIKKLWLAAETIEERLLIVGYCIWGLRTKELPAININQIEFGESNAYIKFAEDERKNGAGEVTVTYGLNIVADLIDQLSQRSDWNGYLFPSKDPNRKFKCSKHMREKFKELARRADVTVGGDIATPKHGRAFYFNAYAAAETDLLERADKIADHQGSEDGKIIRDSYLTDEQKRKYRNVYFRQYIRDMLPNDIEINQNKQFPFDLTEDNSE